jgi:hypothetical protein
VDATAEVAGDEKVWHSINHSILSDPMLLYAVGQKYLVDVTAEVVGNEKDWHSINRLILSDPMLLYCMLSVRSTWWMSPLRWRGTRKTGTL